MIELSNALEFLHHAYHPGPLAARTRPREFESQPIAGNEVPSSGIDGIHSNPIGSLIRGHRRDRFDEPLLGILRSPLHRMQQDDPELRTRPVHSDPDGLPVFLRNHRIGIIVRSLVRDPLGHAVHPVILQELPLQVGIVLSAYDAYHDIPPKPLRRLKSSPQYTLRFQ